MLSRTLNLKATKLVSANARMFNMMAGSTISYEQAIRQQHVMPTMWKT
jgi:hypothetical protein